MDQFTNVDQLGQNILKEGGFEICENKPLFGQKYSF